MPIQELVAIANAVKKRLSNMRAFGTVTRVVGYMPWFEVQTKTPEQHITASVTEIGSRFGYTAGHQVVLDDGRFEVEFTCSKTEDDVIVSSVIDLLTAHIGPTSHLVNMETDDKPTGRVTRSRAKKGG